MTEKELYDVRTKGGEASKWSSYVTSKGSRENEEAWQKGYDAGIKATMRKYDEAIKIGIAILDVLDNRYKREEENY